MKPMLVHVLGQLRRQLAVGERAVAVLGHAPPRAEVHLVDRHRRVERVAPLRALAIHSPVAPLVVERPRRSTPVCGGISAWKANGIGLVDAVAVVRERDVVLVARARADARRRSLPRCRTRRAAAAGARLVPAVEVADHRDALGVRRPDGEVRARRRRRRSTGCAPSFSYSRKWRAFVEQVQVVVGQQRDVVASSVCAFVSGPRRGMRRYRRCVRAARGCRAAGSAPSRAGC